MKRKIPSFKGAEEEALFWESHDILKYVKPDEFKVINPKKNRRYSFSKPLSAPSKELISLRIDSQILKRAKELALRKGMGYQTILRTWLEKGAFRKAS